MAQVIPELSNSEFKFMQDLLKQKTGIKMQESKKTLLTSRLGKRLRHHGFQVWHDYICLLKDNNIEEMTYFTNALTTNKTEFFREKEHFQHIESRIKANPKKSISAWIAASSYGQEAYSLAMTFEKMQKVVGPFDYRILATDIDTDVLQFASQGVYNKQLVQRDVSMSQIKDFFLIGKGQNADLCKVSDKLKKQIKFRQHNLCAFDQKIPMKFDFIMVRNVLIYFDEPTILKVIQKLSNHLQPDGHLITGMCETLKTIPEPLESIGLSVYGRKENASKSSKKISTTITTSPQPSGKTKVLIVDDSKVIQNLIASIVEKNHDFELFGIASDPLEAEKLMKDSEPDLITLDINMPHMNGIEYLEQMIPKRKLPVIMISGVNNEDRKLSLKSMELGAIDFVEKPDLSEMETFIPQLTDKIKIAASARKSHIKKTSVVKVKPTNHSSLRKDKIITIGSSTGGTVALANILQSLPENIPPILIVQHIPKHFSLLFAKRLDSLCPFHVKEAEHMDVVSPGTVYIAPGDKHMIVKKTQDQLKIHLQEGSEGETHVPAVDVLMNSVAQEVGKNTIGAILTGMGRDGAQGLLKMKESGAYTLAQDEESCVVFGMPREAIRLNAHKEIVSLDDFPERLCELLSVSSQREPLAS
ncbi:MAG: chemotaxis-specific protein-glutamate methyltransferase CheB [Oligoflexales bacterium]